MLLVCDQEFGSFLGAQSFLMDCSQDISKDGSLVKTGAFASTVNGLLLWLLARGLSSLLSVEQKPQLASGA